MHLETLVSQLVGNQERRDDWCGLAYTGVYSGDGAARQPGFITGMNSAISVLAPHTAAPESNSDTARMMA